MYKKILVPLDGSELAECVLPHVEAIVKGCHVPEVIFLRVVEPVHFTPRSSYMGNVFTEADARKAEETENAMHKADAENYLTGVLARYSSGAAGGRSLVVFGKPAETIADYAEKNDVDLIVIATHGRSGVSRWVWGSVADRVLRSACVPVFMVRAPGCVPGI